MQEEKTIRFDYSNMLAENFVKPEFAISQQEIEEKQKLITHAYESVMIYPTKETTAYFDLVQNPKDVEEISNYAEYIAKNFENFVVLGIGGSALGARTLFSALTDMGYKKKDSLRNNRPKWFVRDSINPEKFKSLLEVLDITKTMFCVVTKSGGTLETILQLTIVSDMLKQKLGKDFSKNICIITANRQSKLDLWAQKYNVKTFYFSTDVSGRFSVLSAVGLLPAAVIGADIKKILQGAKHMLDVCKKENLKDNPALFGAALQKIAMDKGLNISYAMPYADNLAVFSDWYCQLWAESLGKSIEIDGKKVYLGQTPVSALGTVDQHSQMQLCLDGCYDKVITFVTVNNFKKDIKIPKLESDLLDDYLIGRNLSEIYNTSQKATQQALLDCNRISRNIILESVNEYSMGELLMFFMLETSFMGAMLGINTYDQPSVELIKQNIKKMLNS